MNSLVELKNILDVISFNDGVILTINFILFVFSGQLLGFFYHEDRESNTFLYRKRIIRFINLLIFATIFYGYWRHSLSDQAEGGDWNLKLISSLVAIYSAYLANHIGQYFIREKFGKEREVQGEKKIIETYNTRTFSLMLLLFIVVISLISLIRILGFDSWLEAGGVIGFIGVFLALTQSSWAPDIFSGLIILNSGLVEEGDVVEIVGPDKVLGVVFKTKTFHTEILNLVNNHRIMIKNEKMREYVIHNLSRFASAKGLRENLHFCIAYEVKSDDIQDMISAVRLNIAENKLLNIEHQHEFEIGAVDAGDYAVEWAVYYYTKDIKNLLRNRFKLRELIIAESRCRGISLSTPMLNQIVKPVIEAPLKNKVEA